jgi:hypothetical protein
MDQPHHEFAVIGSRKLTVRPNLEVNRRLRYALGMNDIQSILTERVDDVPLLLEQMQRMHLPTLIDQHFPAHGNWQGLSLGWMSTIWLSSIVSRGDHRMVHVEPWVTNRLWTLRTTTGQAVERLAFTDDRLEIGLRHMSDDTRWAELERALNQHTVRVHDLSTERVHIDCTSASASVSVSEECLFQFGHSKARRPDLPQVKVMQAVLDSLAMPLATDVVSGERADDPLYLPLGTTGFETIEFGRIGPDHPTPLRFMPASLQPTPLVPLMQRGDRASQLAGSL